ncbi:MAG TPA: glycosyltransferase [Janthinobacterium sp.]|nr:glycosyltransferase [Janthinobacterium sp.]
MDFDLEYEVLIKNLKYEFLTCKQWEWYCALNNINDASGDARLGTLQENYRKHLFELQQFIQSNFALFDARTISSLLGVPTQAMSDDEKIIHRIWMGGSPPAIAREAARQWECAIDEAGSEYEARHASLLWVWDRKQLADDPDFLPASVASRYRIGNYAIGTHRHAVHSLHDLALDFSPQNLGLIRELHAKKYFVNLADFFRLLILRQFGGMYLDADTIPYKSATIFLSKPEVPDYIDFNIDARSGKIHQCFVSWMNLAKDENGVLIARKGNPSVMHMVAEMEANLGRLGSAVPDKIRHPAASKTYAAALHDATYGVWQKGIGQTFLSYDDIEKSHSVLHDGKKENVVSGLRGMRLVVDAITKAEVPLNAGEQHSYERCIAALEKRDWRLDNILELESLAEISCIEEVPRMAYAPQLRAEPESCHYYSFLSHDEKLDRVNSLFAVYLTAKNAERIGSGNFWCKTKGRGRQENYHSRISNYAGVSYVLNPALHQASVFPC